MMDSSRVRAVVVQWFPGVEDQESCPRNKTVFFIKKLVNPMQMELKGPKFKLIWIEIRVQGHCQSLSLESPFLEVCHEEVWWVEVQHLCWPCLSACWAWQGHRYHFLIFYKCPPSWFSYSPILLLNLINVDREKTLTMLKSRGEDYIEYGMTHAL